MKVTIDLPACFGLGACEAAASEVFEVGDDGKVHLLDPPGPLEAYRQQIEEAVDDCPMRALRVEG
ncbi:MULTISPECIES: ferredoxin [Gordonia]|uniref:Putative ferredoxin n=1 Tax=Gordonia terrae C-6 TaxID=1316928 RepID=R7Y5N1_9ACTN|nr:MULTISPECIES: ferredoxin [Gordonia]EON31312.1 putative ferredoxin [Gordonia terrae C-6]